MNVTFYTLQHKQWLSIRVQTSSLARWHFYGTEPYLAIRLQPQRIRHKRRIMYFSLRFRRHEISHCQRVWCFEESVWRFKLLRSRYYNSLGQFVANNQDLLNLISLFRGTSVHRTIETSEWRRIFYWFASHVAGWRPHTLLHHVNQYGARRRLLLMIVVKTGTWHNDGTLSHSSACYS